MTMGKWSTYRKRGAPVVAILLRPPPTPRLEVLIGNVVQTTTGLGSPGGKCLLYESYDGGTIWTEADNVGYLSPYDWGDIAAYEGIMIKAAEVGHGVNYNGASEWSTILDFR